MDQATINYEVYEDNNAYVGITETAMPDISFLNESISGAGIAGNIDAVITAMIDAMNVTLNFVHASAATAKLAEPKRHRLTFRAAEQYEDPVAATLGVKAVKHVMECIPKGYKFGTHKPAGSNGGSTEMAVRYWACYAKEKKILELDPLNNIIFINGTDYAAPVRKAMGLAN